VVASAAPSGTSTTPPGGAEVRDRGIVRLESIRAARWSVDGTAKVARDVDVGDVTSRGALSIGGKLVASTFQGRGSVEVEGPVDVAATLSASGELRAASVHAGDLEFRGIFRCAGAIRVDRLASFRGSIETAEISAQVLQLEGGARVPGTLRATSVHARLKDSSELGTIVGGSVFVHARVPNIVDRVLLHTCTVTADRIEGEVVDLEGVDVDFVRSPRITLGRDCHVTRLEGTVVRQHPSSHVGPESRSPAPYGLRR